MMKIIILIILASVCNMAVALTIAEIVKGIRQGNPALKPTVVPTVDPVKIQVITLQNELRQFIQSTSHQLQVLQQEQEVMKKQVAEVLFTTTDIRQTRQQLRDHLADILAEMHQLIDQQRRLCS